MSTHPDNWIATYAYFCVMVGVFVTAFYTFRMLFMTFHGKPRFDTAAAAHDDHAHARTTRMPHDHAHDDHGHGHHGGPPHESPWVVWVRWSLLAIPSIIIGALTVEPLLFGGGFGESIVVNEHHNIVPELHEEFGDWVSFALHSVAHPVLYLLLAGVLSAWALYIKWPHLPGLIDAKLKPLRVVLENKYFFDWFNEKVLARRQPLAWQDFLEGRRSIHHRQGGSRWLRAHGRLHRRHREACADRIPLFLCVLDGHRTRRHARLVRDTRLI